MRCIGIDPDLHDLAIATWTDDGPEAIHIIHVPKRKGRIENIAALDMLLALTKPWPINPQVDFAAVESQELGRSRFHKRPQDIVTLGQVAGMACMRLAAAYLDIGIYFPKPSEWKKQKAKHAMQASLYSDLGWGFEVIYDKAKKPQYAVPGPACPYSLPKTQWKHAGDALLLAKWCYEQADQSGFASETVRSGLGEGRSEARDQ